MFFLTLGQSITKTAAGGGAVIAASQDVTTNTDLTPIIDQQTANARRGWYFRSSATGTLDTLSFFMWREGGLSTGTYAVELRNYTSGGTVGSIIQSVNVDPDGLTTLNTGELITVTFGVGTVTAGSDYCFIFNETGLTGNGVYELRGTSSATTSNNQGNLESSDGGSSWTEVDASEYSFTATLA